MSKILEKALDLAILEEQNRMKALPEADSKLSAIQEDLDRTTPEGLSYLVPPMTITQPTWIDVVGYTVKYGSSPTRPFYGLGKKLFSLSVANDGPATVSVGINNTQTTDVPPNQELSMSYKVATIRYIYLAVPQGQSASVRLVGTA
jgi:hypothetical protein